MILQALFLVAGLQQAPDLSLTRMTLDPARSEVGFDAESTLHDFTGRTKRVEGELRADLAHLESCAAGRISVLAKSVDTDSNGRNKKMRKLLEADDHPWITFEFSRASGSLANRRGDLRVKGTFTVRGRTRTAEFPVRVTPVGSEGLRVEGRVQLEMTDFGIDPPGLLFVSTEDEVEVWWNVVFAPAPATPVPARVHPVSLTELQPGRESATPEVSAQRLWIAGESSLWERPSRWTLAQGGKVSELELATGRSAPLPASSEESFAAIRERLANLRAEQATASEERRLSLEESVRQISRILALAPPEVAPTLERSGDDIELRFGETAWLVLRGNHGKGRVAPLFASIAGIPEAALELLQTIEHVPAEVELRTGTPAGARIYRIRIEPAQRAELPDWALEPKGWTKGES